MTDLYSGNVLSPIAKNLRLKSKVGGSIKNLGCKPSPLTSLVSSGI